MAVRRGLGSSGRKYVRTAPPTDIGALDGFRSLDSAVRTNAEGLRVSVRDALTEALIFDLGVIYAFT